VAGVLVLVACASNGRRSRMISSKHVARLLRSAASTVEHGRVDTAVSKINEARLAYIGPPERMKQFGVTIYYVLFIYQDIEPSLCGPFKTQAEQNKKARTLKKNEGNDHGIFWLDKLPDGTLQVGSYSGGFFEGEDR
jgi:hypothetical protein